MVDIPGNTTSTAMFVGNPAVGATFSGELETFGDIDYIRITLQAGVTYRFYGSVQGAGAGVGNSDMSIRNTAGTALFGNDDDPAGGQNSFFAFAPATTGTYFVAIESATGLAGEYSIAVTALAGTDNRQTVNDDTVPALLNRRIIGDKGDDTITLGSNSHALGEQGDDVINGDGTANFISGGLGNDSLFGNGGIDTIFGDAGLDFINGGSGNDKIYGGAGADNIVDIGGGQDHVFGGDGADFIEGGTDNDNLIGEQGDDVLHGQQGEDILNGGIGIDEMHGGASDDKFFVDNAADKAMENTVDGTGDTVYTTVTYSLFAGQEIEFLRVQVPASVTAINLTGNQFANTLVGNNGNNGLRGGLGADVLHGLLGNDIYVLENGNDTVVDTGGNDAITSTITRSLAGYAAIEGLTLAGAGAINGTGNNLANAIFGNAAANTLDGGVGNDALNGGGGNDILIGNAGKDTMTGGALNDTFLFAATAHSPVGANADVISDFDDSGDDRIDISGLLGPALVYRGDQAFTAAGQVRINDIVGVDLLVEVNTGGTLAADMQIRLTNTTLASMAVGDFVL